jgi:fructose-1,6-bisphosphatase I
MSPPRQNLSGHLRAESSRPGATTPGVATLIEAIAGGAIRLAREVRRAALEGETGLSGVVNPTGDSQKRLDVVADREMTGALESTGLVAGLVSEESDEAKTLARGARAEYVVCIDPLDGSSNSDVGGAVGTIFGIFRRAGGGPLDVARDLLRPGAEQAASGYVLYGPGTILVQTTGRGTFGFTLDDDRGEFLLTHDAMRCPARGRSYSANLGNIRRWHPHVRAYVDHVTTPDKATSRPYSLRYSGALVADLHRSLLEGGIYFYPADPAHASGKLRLMYECGPLALVVEQAGGKASTGDRRILDVRAESIHQRVPFVVGSADDVALFEQFTQEGGPSSGLPEEKDP